jgi:hypothetical protein
LALAAGCSDDKKKSQNDAGPDGGGGPDSITIINMEWSLDDEVWVPVEGITVAFDAPGGERTEAVSGADGKVTFDGFDWTAGTAAATSHMEGYLVNSLVGLDADTVDQVYQMDGAVMLATGPEIEPDTEPETVSVSGTVTGFLDTAHDLVVNVVNTTFGGDWNGPSDGTFTVDVPSGEPFVLQAVEWVDGPAPESGQGYTQEMFQWMQQSFDAVTEDQVDIVLDFTGNAMELFTADVTTDVPDDQDSPICSGYAVCNVCDQSSYYCQGWSTSVDISEDGTQFEASFLWVEPDYAEDPWYYCAVYNPTGWSLYAYNLVEGYPEDGSSMGQLIDVPIWVSPTPGNPQNLYDPLEWQFSDDDLPLILINLYRMDDFIWQIIPPPNATTATIPEPPSTFDASILEGAGNIRTELMVVTHDLETNWVSEIAYADMVYLTVD